MEPPSLDVLLDAWRLEESLAKNIVYWVSAASRAAETCAFPADIHPALAYALEQHGITAFYTHQAVAWQAIRAGENIVIATGTASGKTLCYNLPILQGALDDPKLCALYLFPTKALTHDQKESLDDFLTVIKAGAMLQPGQEQPAVAVYDGDAPSGSRAAIRKKVRLLLTNPDMLHTAILPHHTLWASFFTHLRFIVIDEMHMYRGVFGSHIANLVRRLKRVAHFYGTYPRFILTSATIANPRELAERLTGEKSTLVDADGSPRGRKHFLIYNPPIVHPELGVRRSAAGESIRLANQLLEKKIQTIMFAQTRRNVEMILRHLQQIHAEKQDELRGYRSGYLPKERRAIEKSLREGRVKLVVATNALELGIDIGGMEAVVLVGYPGTIAATRQQAGRAGRRDTSSLAVLVVSAGPLDQFLAQHPEYLLDRSPEKAFVNPDNPLILLQHLRCAAFELPIQSGENFGTLPWDALENFVEVLREANELVPSGNRFFWMGAKYPAEQLSLRSTGGQTVLIQVEEEGEAPTVIGAVDLPSSLWMVHPKAIYLHEGKTYQVKELRLEERLAILAAADVDYYTEARQESQVQKISVTQTASVTAGNKAQGEILVTSQVTGFTQKRWFTHELLGSEELTLPPTQLHTTAYWLVLNQDAVEAVKELGLWHSDNAYGPHWEAQKNLARRRDQYTCQMCGAVEQDRAHPVHHKIPFRLFSSWEKANALENLITLCPACHRQAEINVRVRSGLAGLCYLLCQLAPLFLMCDSSDLGAHSDPQSPLGDGNPTLVIYDRAPAGVGLSDALYRLHDELLRRAYERAKSCPCADGCPSCVGPGGENGQGGKAEALALLRQLQCENAT